MKRFFASLLLVALKSYFCPTPRERDRSTLVTVEIMKFIGEHYAEYISLATLAQRFGYGKTYLSRVLNKTLNMNFREYLNRVRITAVKRLRSAEPHASLYRLAEECGFKSKNTFYRAYKRVEEAGHSLIWYVCAQEYGWFRNMLEHGDIERCHEIVRDVLRCAISDEYYMLDRYHEVNVWYSPWSPNASCNARLFNILLDLVDRG